MTRHLFTSALVVTCVVAVNTAVGSERVPGYPDDLQGAFDPREVALLPRYCIHAQAFRDRVPGGNNGAEIQRWYALLGGMFHHMHHYCWGLMGTHRALHLARTAQVRNSYLRYSIREFDYVLQFAPDNFPLLPEILTKKGENLIRLGRSSPAVVALLRAIELKADYWPPYAALGDYYKEVGELDKARAILEKGLLFSPDAKGLERRLAELSGPKAKPKPAPPAAAQRE